MFKLFSFFVVTFFLLLTLKWAWDTFLKAYLFGKKEDENDTVI